MAHIYLASPHMSEEGYEQQYVKEAFDTNWIAPLGKNVNEFEKEMAAYVGAKDAAALSSGSAALHLALKAGIKIPEELKIVTYDGTDISRLVYPEATSIRQNIKMLAELSANSVVDLIENRRPVPNKQIIPVELYQGQTTYPVDTAI